jgi:hypothetical protein
MRLAGGRHVAAVALAKAAAAGAVLASGFRAVSDDDFARVVIAEQWARAPRWDASGTSWLPAPFWLVGAALAAFGRGLGAARAAAVALGIAAALLVYTAARWLGEPRDAAAAGAVVAAVFPWSARLGVATVPELPAAALTLLAMAALAPQEDAGVRGTRRLLGAAALVAATLSRYEAWPVAILFAAVCLVDAVRERSGRAGLAAGLALLGPAAWVAWNRVAHHDALHFVARVTAYRHALGGPEEGAAARLLAYPLAMAREEPEIVALLVAAAALVAARGGRAALREGLSRYARPAAIVAAQIAALSLAMVRDGAPTHHPERAVLAALLLVAVAAGALATRALRGGGLASGARAALLLGAVALAAKVARPATPREGFAARGDEEAAGRAAATLARPGEPVLVEVADYGYLAVTAALGRPEDAVPDRSIDPRDARVASSFDDPAALARRLAASGARWIVARAAARATLGEPVAVRGAWAVFARPEETPAP